jgi:hypothetical protein
VRLGNVCLCGLARCVHSGDCRPMLTALSDSAVVQVGERVLSRDVLKVSRMNARPGRDGGGFVEGHPRYSGFFIQSGESAEAMRFSRSMAA